MRSLFYFLIGFFSAGILMIASAKADTLEQLAFRKGCQYTMASLSLDQDADFMRGHCDHLTNIYKVDQSNNPVINAPLIKAIREYNFKQLEKKRRVANETH